MADLRIVFCIVAICTLGVCAGFQCPSAGKFVDPENCHNYYICDSNLEAKERSCNIFGHFDPSVQRCVMGSDCAGAGPTTAAPQPGFTTSSPTTGFQCTAPGRFRDPNRCHDFYVCDANLHATHKSCNEFGYFDENSGFCVIGSCPDDVSTSAPNRGFACPAIDGYYADPTDCRFFYTCKYGIAVRGVCNGGGGHFDKKQSGCVPGPC